MKLYIALLQEDIARLSVQLAVLRGQFADKTAEQLELQVCYFADSAVE